MVVFSGHNLSCNSYVKKKDNICCLLKNIVSFVTFTRELDQSLQACYRGTCCLSVHAAVKGAINREACACGDC